MLLPIFDLLTLLMYPLIGNIPLYIVGCVRTPRSLAVSRIPSQMPSQMPSQRLAGAFLHRLCLGLKMPPGLKGCTCCAWADLGLCPSPVPGPPPALPGFLLLFARPMLLLLLLLLFSGETREFLV